MFPVTKDYIDDIYVNQKNEAIRIAYIDERQIIHKAKTAFRLHYQGIRVFLVAIDFIKAELIKKLNSPKP